mgnify:CR=1 FL=1
MKHNLLALAAAALAVSTSGAALANHHDQGHGGYKMEKMEDGTMQCCMMDHDKMDHGTMDHGSMDHSTMHHGNMDHSKMNQGNMAQPATPAAKPN